MSPTFNYVSGDISHLTGSGPALMPDLQGPFTDLRAALNGNLDETNVPNLTAAFTTYKPYLRGSAVIAAAAGTYLLQVSHSVNSNVVAGAATALVTQHLIWLDPTDHNANTRTTKLRIRAVCIPNAVAPGPNFTVGLYPVATFGGASSADATVATLGAVVAGSAAVVNAPPAATASKTDGPDFNMPAAGAYVLAVLTSAGTAAGSITDVMAFLQFRQV